MGGGTVNQRSRIRVSTMEIVLIGVLVGSLILSLIQARREEEDRQAAHEH